MKKNQKFAYEASENYTVPPEFWTDMPNVEPTDIGIKKVDEKSFYPYEDGECGRSTVIIYVFKATKKGTFQLKLDDDKIIKVIVI